MMIPIWSKDSVTPYCSLSVARKDSRSAGTRMEEEMPGSIAMISRTSTLPRLRKSTLSSNAPSLISEKAALPKMEMTVRVWNFWPHRPFQIFFCL